MGFRRLHEKEKVAIYAVLKHNSVKGKPRYGDIKQQAGRYEVSDRAIQRVRDRGQRKMSFKTTMPKRRTQSDIRAIQERVAQLPTSKKQDIRTMAAALSEPKSTLHDWFSDGILARKSSSLKPILTPANMESRMNYTLSFTQETKSVISFHPMYDRVFLDKKWCYLRKIKNIYYLAPWEEVPQQSTKNKRFITSVMFLPAVARPTVVDGVEFDGKIGIWPFVQRVAAQRSSRNRAAGTEETKSVSVTRSRYTKMLLDNVFPAIFEKFPVKTKNIIVQHDNATPHGITSNVEIIAAMVRGDRNIWFGSQPANSLDLNILDLGFFNSIQALQQKMSAYTIDELIDNAQQAFANVPPVSLETVMESIIQSGGDNKFKLKHLVKEAKRRRGELEESFPCCVDSYLSVCFDQIVALV
jgi:hypothetical protein